MQCVNIVNKNMPMLRYDNALLLTSLDDLAPLDDVTKKVSEDFLGRVISSKLPKERYDHIWEDSLAGSAWSGAIMSCKIKGGYPFGEYQSHIDKRRQHIRNDLEKGMHVVVQRVGSWFSFNPAEDEYEITPAESGVKENFMPKAKVKLIPGSYYINLENDPKVEPETVRLLKNLGEDSFSSVTSLRNMDEGQLYEVLCEFVAAGGAGLFQYTTAMDLDQMDVYLGVAKKAGIKDVKIVLSMSQADWDEHRAMEFSSIIKKYQDSMEVSLDHPEVN